MLPNMHTLARVDTVTAVVSNKKQQPGCFICIILMYSKVTLCKKTSVRHHKWGVTDSQG